MTAPDARAERARRVRRVLWAVLAANLAVVLAKLAVGVRAGSIAVLGDAAHSGADALNNVVALLAVRAAAAPPDEEHPYGHGKFEVLGALAVASFLSITCYELVSGAVGRLLGDPPPPRVETLTFAVLGATAVVNVGVAWAEARLARRLESPLLAADARHTRADVLVTLAVLGGLVVVRAGWGAADAWLALAVAVVIARSGWQIVAGAIPVLVDTRAVEAERIRAFARRIPGVLDVADIRSRGRPGVEAYAECTIRVAPEADVRQAHAVADAVERALMEAGGFADVVVHVEPASAEAARGPGQERVADGDRGGAAGNPPAARTPLTPPSRPPT